MRRFIEVELGADGFLTVTDNGRGIPVDPHPKFPKKSALEVIMCTLHAGGKFDSKVYETSGGLHGVGVSVVNALSERLEVEVARGQQLYRMVFERGKPKGKLEELGKVNNRRGTTRPLQARPEIFGAKATFKPAAPVQDGALQGLSVRRRRNPLALRSRRCCKASTDVPAEDELPLPRRPEGLSRRRVQRRHAGASRHLLRQVRPATAPTAPSNGRSPGPPTPTASSPPTATPIPTPRRRHPRIRPAQRAAARPEGPCRAHRPGQARGADHRATT